MHPIKHTLQFALFSFTKVSRMCCYSLERIQNSCLKKRALLSSICSSFLYRHWQRQGLDHQAEAQQPCQLLLSALMPTTALWELRSARKAAASPKKLQPALQEGTLPANVTLKTNALELYALEEFLFSKRGGCTEEAPSTTTCF